MQYQKLFVDLNDVFTKIITVAWRVLRKSWYFPQTGEMTQWFNGIIGQNKITAKHDRVCILWFFIVITIYRWTVSQAYFNGNKWIDVSQHLDAETADNIEYKLMWPLLLTWFNFNPSMHN